MAHDVFIGRRSVVRHFKESVSRILEETNDKTTFLSFRKQKEPEVLFPRLFLIHGNDGMGKTALINNCIQAAGPVASEGKKTLKTIRIDTTEEHTWFSTLNFSIGNIITLFYAAVERPSSKISSYFSEYQRLVPKIKAANDKFEYILKNDWTFDYLQGHRDSRPLSTGTSKEILHLYKNECLSWVRDQKKMAEDEIDLIAHTEQRLCNALVNGFIKVSVQTPVLLCIDVPNQGMNELCQTWLRENFLKPLFEHENRIIALVSSSSNVLRKYRNQFREELLYSIPMADNTFSCFDIIECAKHESLTWDTFTADQVEKATNGIPLLVREVCSHVKSGADLPAVLHDIPNEFQGDILYSGIVDRFLTHSSDAASKTHLFHFALTLSIDKKILSAIWNISAGEIEAVLKDLSHRLPFISAAGFTPAVKHQFRKHLMLSFTSSATPDVRVLLEGFASQSASLYAELLAQITTNIPGPDKRYTDKEFCLVFLEYMNSLLWQINRDEFFNLFPDRFLECLLFNPELAEKLISLACEFGLVLTKKQQALVDIAHAGLAVWQPEALFLQVPPDPAEETMVKHFVAMANKMNESTQAIAHSLAAELSYRKGDYTGAWKSFESISTKADFALVLKERLYTDCMAIGMAYSPHTDKATTLTILTKATAILPERHEAWFALGLTYTHQQNHTKAVEAYEHVVQIKPDLYTAWSTLASELFIQNKYAEAIPAYNKALDSKTDSIDLLYHLGLSYAACNEHNEAIKVFEKHLRNNNQDTIVLYSKALSHFALDEFDHGVRSCRQALEIKPDDIQTGILLAERLFEAKKYRESIEITEKVVAQDKNNAQVWNKLGLACFYTNNLERAIEACTVSSQLNAQSFESFNTLGMCFLSQNKFADAIQAFEQALAIDNSVAESWNQLGSAYNAVGKTAKAQEAYTHAVSANPDFSDAWLNLGFTYQAQENYSEALVQYKKAAQLTPDKQEIWYNIGLSHHALKHYAEAIESYKKASELSPDSYETWFHMGLCAMATAQNAEAITAFEKATQCKSEAMDAYFELGKGYALDGQHDKAITALCKANELSSHNPEIMLCLGKSYEEEKNYTKAKETLEHTVQLSPKSHDAWTHLGLVCYSTAAYEDAIKAYSMSLDLQGDNPAALLNLGRCHHAVGNNTEALKYYTQALEHNPENAEILYNCALVNHALDRFDQAIEFYKKTRELTPDPDDGLFYNLGLAHHALAHYAEAAEAYRNALERAPDKSDIWMTLATIYDSLSQYGDAVDAYSNIVRIEPKRSEAWYSMGHAYYYWGHYNDAINAYSEAVKINPDYFTAWGSMGLAYYAMGNFPQSVDACKKALAIKSDESWIRSTLAIATLLSRDLNGATAEYHTFAESATTPDEISQALTMLKGVLAYDSRMAQSAKGIVTELEAVLARLQ